MSLSSVPALIVAAADLKVVQLVRRAMLVADLTVAAELGADRCCRRRDDKCEPCGWPEPAIAPCQPATPLPNVDRYEPSCRPLGTVYGARPTPPAPPPVEVVVVRERDPMESPLQPPWKVLPWENPAQPAPKVKVVRYTPDRVSSGTILDCFI